MLAELIATPKAAFTTHGAPALKDAIRACVDAAILARVRDACQKAGLSLLSIAAQRRISELTVGTCALCGRVDVGVSGGLLRSHLRRVGDTDGGGCLGSGEAPVAAIVEVSSPGGTADGLTTVIESLTFAEHGQQLEVAEDSVGLAGFSGHVCDGPKTMLACHLRDLGTPGDVAEDADPFGALGLPMELTGETAEVALDVDLSAASAASHVVVHDADPDTIARVLEDVATRHGWVCETVCDLGGRDEQQDYWAVVEVGDALLAIVADGMGGHANGADASERAANAFIDSVRRNGPSLTSMRVALHAADEALAPHYPRAPGTTLTALLLTADAAYLAHVGDSAAHRLSGDEWLEVSIRHGIGNHLDLCLGSGGLASSDLTPQLEALPPSDAWLLCSDGLVPDLGRDGLWSPAPRLRMSPAFFGTNTLGRTLDAAREAGSTDNATGILLYRTSVTWDPLKGSRLEIDGRSTVVRGVEAGQFDSKTDARGLAAWSAFENPPVDVTPEPSGVFGYDAAEGLPVKMRCESCLAPGVDAKRWRAGKSLFALQHHDTPTGAPCQNVGQKVAGRQTTLYKDATSDDPTPAAETPPAAEPAPEPPGPVAPYITHRQAGLLAKLLDTQDVSVEARQALDEPRWSDTGEPVEDDAPLLREALRLEEGGKARSSYLDDFRRKLTLLEAGRRLPKRGRVAATVEREPVNSEPVAGEEMAEVDLQSLTQVEGDAGSALTRETLEAGLADLVCGFGIIPPEIAALAETIRPDVFADGHYTRGEVMTFRRAWELGISEAVALEDYTTPVGWLKAGVMPEPACNFPMDGTEAYAGTWVLEMVPVPGNSFSTHNRKPRQARACTENEPAEITPAQARLYLERLTDDEVVKLVKERGNWLNGADEAERWGSLDRRRGIPRDLCPFDGAEADGWQREWDACDEDMRSHPDETPWVPILGDEMPGVGAAYAWTDGPVSPGTITFEESSAPGLSAVTVGSVDAPDPVAPPQIVMTADGIDAYKAAIGEAIDATNGLILAGILSALGVSSIADAHSRIDALRQAEKGLAEVLAAAGEVVTAPSLAAELAKRQRHDAAPPVPVSITSYSVSSDGIGRPVRASIWVEITRDHVSALSAILASGGGWLRGSR